jgi:hypothetical protein
MSKETNKVKYGGDGFAYHFAEYEYGSVRCIKSFTIEIIIREKETKV